MLFKRTAKSRSASNANRLLLISVAISAITSGIPSVTLMFTAGSSMTLTTPAMAHHGKHAELEMILMLFLLRRYKKKNHPNLTRRPPSA